MIVSVVYKSERSKIHKVQTNTQGMAQQPTQCTTNSYDSKLQFAIALSGVTHNPKGYESPVYTIWDLVLNELVIATQNCSIHPQLQLTHEQNLEEGIPHVYSRIPDFGVLIKQGHEGLLRAYLLLVENKPLPLATSNEDGHINIQQYEEDEVIQVIERKRVSSQITLSEK